MTNPGRSQKFNNPEVIVEGWYWALPSRELHRGQARGLRFLGRDLVLFRGDGGKIHALDAHCPHMGAHLKDGTVENDAIRCPFHNWRFEANGRCSDVPCQKPQIVNPKLASYTVEEKYGVAWIYAGETPRMPIPYVPELKDAEVDAALGASFVKEVHPNVVMINAIDAQHFNSVHPMVKKLAGRLHLEPVVMNGNNVEFRNTTKVPTDWWFGRLLSRFYADALTYWMSYWFGSTGSVTIGPDFLHFHIIFALRPNDAGHAEGQTILVTKKRKGIAGAALNRILLFLTKLVGSYFAKGDTMIFRSIKFDLRTPIKEDQAIIRFMRHLEEQPLSSWSRAVPALSARTIDTPQRSAAIPVSTPACAATFEQRTADVPLRELETIQ